MTTGTGGRHVFLERQGAEAASGLLYLHFVVSILETDGRDMASGPGRRTVAAREFKAHCLQLMREISETREEIIITRHKSPIARLVPIGPEQTPIRGRDKGRMRILGDIVTSAFDDEHFDMEDDPERAIDPVAR